VGFKNIRIEIQWDFFAGYSPERINPGIKNIPLRKY
jgi:UDP-N-acetyl-D-mannosaminuronate dehydrogenase